MKTILCILLGYLLGSLPFALIIGKVFYHTDIRQYGSGNLGGTNAGRVLGKKAGISVIVFDVLIRFHTAKYGITRPTLCYRLLTKCYLLLPEVLFSLIARYTAHHNSLSLPAQISRNHHETAFEIHCHTRYPVFGGYLLLPGRLECK